MLVNMCPQQRLTMPVENEQEVGLGSVSPIRRISSSPSLLRNSANDSLTNTTPADPSDPSTSVVDSTTPVANVADPSRLSNISVSKPIKICAQDSKTAESTNSFVDVAGESKVEIVQKGSGSEDDGKAFLDGRENKRMKEVGATKEMISSLSLKLYEEDKKATAKEERVENRERDVTKEKGVSKENKTKKIMSRSFYLNQSEEKDDDVFVDISVVPSTDARVGSGSRSESVSGRSQDVLKHAGKLAHRSLSEDMFASPKAVSSDLLGKGTETKGQSRFKVYSILIL